MFTKNKFIVGTLIASTFFVAGVFADDSASGTTSTGITNTGVILTGSIDNQSGSILTGTTSTGVLDTQSGSTSTGEIISTGTTNSGVTSTGTTSTGAKAEIEKNRAHILANWSQFHEDYGFIKQFLKIPATKAEAKTLTANIKSDLKAYHEEVKALIKEGQNSIKANTFDPTIFNTKTSEIFTRQIETLSKYVDSAKMDSFKKFMEEKQALILSNKDLRKANFDLKQEVKELKKKFLSEKQRIAVAKKLEDRTINFYNKLIGRIDAFIAKAKNETLKAQLSELKDMTQVKLDELNK